ncbi:hypothetical protein D3Z45_09295 [Lachnospiraceae bacterium]|nr:hypothetical protein [Lachnospiraceae bacterium]
MPRGEKSGRADGKMPVMPKEEQTMIESNRMTAGSPAKHILKLAFPLMFGNIFQQMYTIVDTAVVGKALGVNALAALGTTEWMIFSSFLQFSFLCFIFCT